MLDWHLHVCVCACVCMYIYLVDWRCVQRLGGELPTGRCPGHHQLTWSAACACGAEDFPYSPSRRRREGLVAARRAGGGGHAVHMQPPPGPGPAAAPACLAALASIHTSLLLAHTHSITQAYVCARTSHCTHHLVSACAGHGQHWRGDDMSALRMQSLRSRYLRRCHADLREDTDWEDHHTGCGAQ